MKKSKKKISKNVKIKKPHWKVRRVFRFKTKVTVWAGSGSGKKDNSGAWRFARVPEDVSAKIKEMQKGKVKRGWGAVYVEAKIGKSRWITSIFPDKHSKTYLLPLKKEIRYEENLYDGIDISVALGV